MPRVDECLGVVIGQQNSPLGLGQATPNAVRLANAQREREAILANSALCADVLRVQLARFALVAAFRCRRRKEHRRFGSTTCRAQMPRFMNKAECHAYSVPQFPPARRKVSGPIRCDKRKFLDNREKSGVSRARSAVSAGRNAFCSHARRPTRVRPRAGCPLPRRPAPCHPRRWAWRDSCGPATARP